MKQMQVFLQLVKALVPGFFAVNIIIRSFSTGNFVTGLKELVRALSMATENQALEHT